MARTRKITQEILDVLERHRNMVEHLGSESWNQHYGRSEADVANIMRGMNIVIEDMLMAHKCYGGFRYVGPAGRPYTADEMQAKVFEQFDERRHYLS